MNFVGPEWTEHELTIMRDKWLSGWIDHEIANHLGTRTAKAIQSKRRELKLLTRFHPERPHRRGCCATQYSRDDEIDILRRCNAQESVASIAANYRVSVRAMESKIECLQERGLTPRVPPKTERECLACGVNFLSILPKSVNRRCPGCHATLFGGGASFLTAY